MRSNSDELEQKCTSSNSRSNKTLNGTKNNQYVSKTKPPQNICFATTPWSRFKGLMGKQHFKDVLLLSPCSDIHTFGMRMNIDVAFLDKRGSVLKTGHNVAPHRRIRCRGAVAVLEREASPDLWYNTGDVVALTCARAP